MNDQHNNLLALIEPIGALPTIDDHSDGIILPSHFVLLADDAEQLALDSDCNCACPQALPTLVPTQLSAHTLLQRHPQQRAIALGDGYQALFVPSVSRVAVVNDAAYRLLREFQVPRLLESLDPAALETAQQLLRLGLLRPSGQPDQPPPPADELVAWLHVTNACNLRCTYCYIDKTDQAMSADTAFAAVDAVLRSAQHHGYKRVLLKFAGGEASLNLALVEQMQHYAQVQAELAGIELRGVVLSNGVGLTRHKLQRIHSLGLRLMISLDGPQAFHDAQRPTIHGQGTYTATIGSIERALALGIGLTVSVTITGASVAGLPEVVAWLLERKAHFTLNFYRENDCSSTFRTLKIEEQTLIAGMRSAYQVIESNLPRYSLLNCLLDRANLGAAHSRTCAVGDNYLVIDHDGNIAKCQMEITQPVTTVWAADPLKLIRLDAVGVQNVPVEQKEGCRDCEWRYWCAGGCAIATFRATGRYDIRSPNCAIYQALYPDVLRLEGLRLLRYHAPR
jgi:uncharacterized protein